MIDKERNLAYYIVTLNGEIDRAFLYRASAQEQFKNNPRDMTWFQAVERWHDYIRDLFKKKHDATKLYVSMTGHPL